MAIDDGNRVFALLPAIGKRLRGSAPQRYFLAAAATLLRNIGLVTSWLTS
jgi:hypothetical protein